MRSAITMSPDHGGAFEVLEGAWTPHSIVIVEFPDMAALLAYQVAHEQRLVAEGFVLEEFSSERRRWPR